MPMVVTLKNGTELDIEGCELAALGRRGIRNHMSHDQLLECVEMAADENVLWGRLKEACAAEVRRRSMRGKDGDDIMPNETYLEFQDILGDVLRDRDSTNR